jgi:hypothetical protein
MKIAFRQRRCLLEQAPGLVRLALAIKNARRFLVGLPGIRIEAKRRLHLGTSFLLAPAHRKMPGSRQMRFGDGLIQRQGMVRRGKPVINLFAPAVRITQIGLRKAEQGPRPRVARIEFRDALADADDAPFTPAFTEIAVDPILPRHEEQIVGVGIACPAMLDCLFLVGKQLELQGVDDRL